MTAETAKLSAASLAGKLFARIERYADDGKILIPDDSCAKASRLPQRLHVTFRHIWHEALAADAVAAELVESHYVDSPKNAPSINDYDFMTAYNRERIAIRLRSLREAAGISVYELAKRLNNKPTQMTLGRWEKGDRSPTADVLPQLAEALGCTVADFFG